MTIYLPHDLWKSYGQLTDHDLAQSTYLLLISSLSLTVDSIEHAPAEGFYLALVDGEIVMQQDQPESAVVKVDFNQGASAHRRRFGGGLGQDIAKAVGVTSQYRPTVIDATAGLGRDTFVLATLGCQVTALERNPGVAVLLQDGLQRGANDPEVAEIIQRIQFNFAVSTQFLNQIDQPFAADVIYIDPMFEHTGRQTAKVKKDMQAFRQLVGHDDDGQHLLEAALKKARCRVVVKRARKAPCLSGRSPSYAITGKSNRYDVYALRKVGPE